MTETENMDAAERQRLVDAVTDGLEEVERLKSRESRIVANSAEDITNLRRVYQRKVEEAEATLNSCLPSTEGFSQLKLFYAKRPFMSSRLFAVAKKETLVMDKYQLGVQIYQLPDEHKIRFPCIMLAYFDVNGKFCDFGICSRNWKNRETFHSTSTHVCVGENKAVLKMAELKKPATIVKAFDDVKQTLETINPSSYLNRGSSSFTKTRRFIDTQVVENRRTRRAAERNDEEENCNNCGESLDNCECCSDCGNDGNNCTCNRCDDCENDYDNCDCERCSECSERLHTTNYDQCRCERCPNCHETVAECICSPTAEAAAVQAATQPTAEPHPTDLMGLNSQ